MRTWNVLCFFSLQCAFMGSVLIRQALKFTIRTMWLLFPPGLIEDVWRHLMWILFGFSTISRRLAGKQMWELFTMNIDYPRQPGLPSAKKLIKNKKTKQSTHTHTPVSSRLHCRGCQLTDWLVVMETTERRFSVRAQIGDGWGVWRGLGIGGADSPSFLFHLFLFFLFLVLRQHAPRRSAAASLASRDKRPQKRSLWIPTRRLQRDKRQIAVMVFSSIIAGSSCSVLPVQHVIRRRAKAQQSAGRAAAAVEPIEVKSFIFGASTDLRASF